MTSATPITGFSQLPPLPYNVPRQVLALASKVKLALFDVDGVLTDGSLHYSQHGEELKTFHALDGHGLKMLQRAGIDVGVISARNSPALSQRLSDLDIAHQHLGVNNKLTVFQDLLKILGLTAKETCFTGDDVIDLSVMLKCGLKFSVANGHFIVRDSADWVTPIAGGSGAVRVICDVLLYSQKNYPLDASYQQ